MDANEGGRGVVAPTASFPYCLPKQVVRYGRLETGPFIPTFVGDDSPVKGIAQHIPNAVPREQSRPRDTVSRVLADVACSEALAV